jgi:hypothetical protein
LHDLVAARMRLRNRRLHGGTPTGPTWVSRSG